MPSIQREIKQSRPFQSAGQEAVVSLLCTAAVVRRRFEAHCEEHGLAFQQYNVLRILRGAETAGEGPLPTMEVADRMIEPEPGITRMMERLEKKGLVRREVEFLANVTDFRSAEVKSVAVEAANDTTMVEWFFDYDHRKWGARRYHQVAVQRWRDGLIVHERFNYEA